VTFVIYGVLCTASFRENDPAHFSTVGTSMFSLFRISTMDVSPSLSPLLQSPHLSRRTGAR
jgi:hypothetical protein